MYDDHLLQSAILVDRCAFLRTTRFTGFAKAGNPGAVLSKQTQLFIFVDTDG